MNKKLISLAMLVSILVFVTVFAFSCSGGNSLSGAWVVEGNNGIQFKGKKFYLTTNTGAMANFMGAITKAQDGTYSISDGKIEMSFSDGKIQVYPFSRTENTIKIGGEQLTRKK